MIKTIQIRTTAGLVPVQAVVFGVYAARPYLPSELTTIETIEATGESWRVLHVPSGMALAKGATDWWWAPWFAVYLAERMQTLAPIDSAAPSKQQLKEMRAAYERAQKEKP